MVLRITFRLRCSDVPVRAPRCKGEPGYRGRFSSDPELHPGEDELADISLVGAYGLNTVWADGHNTGIYTYRAAPRARRRVGVEFRRDDRRRNAGDRSAAPADRR